eukprot:5955456-Pleurochrysis_carterae.AAC.3
MRAGYWRSQASSRFEALGACRADGPDATPLTRRTARGGAKPPARASRRRTSGSTHPSARPSPRAPFP